jgi:hypothetical protein
MNAEQYLDYLIESAVMCANGVTSIHVQPIELKTLKVLLASENALRVHIDRTVAVNKNGNPL